ncbi:hypothetical protein TELCIR_16529 [Teladorsagia circumcincta]|uniref:Peptidase A2 domain-containing protein n=1 Tax=Teladorsagia circumcincta TaxID=45464 RepID=A0A2G9TV86_TELCI|nr:hypothetical protein TELCIR_16529 [Teladorsagia circumcincta]
MLEMEVNVKKIPFELDSGASLSIIDEKTWNKLGRPQLNKAARDCGPHYDAAYNVEQMPKVEIKKGIVRILNNNKRLFQDGLGKCITARAEFKFKSDTVVPRFFRARPVPIAMRPKVEAKLEEMVQNGTIRRVEHSKWATSLVLVPKPGGKTRICGDYKVTVNPQLDINQ